MTHTQVTGTNASRSLKSKRSYQNLLFLRVPSYQKVPLYQDVRDCRRSRHQAQGQTQLRWHQEQYTDDDVAKLVEFAHKRCSYLVYGKEFGKNTGTHHLQIYFEMHNTMSMKAVLKNVGFNMWLGYRRGNSKQAAGYCMKGTETKIKCWSEFYDNPSMTWKGDQFGEITNQGERTDLNIVADMIVHEKKTH